MSSFPRAARREVVGVFTRRDDFDAAVKALRDTGFSRADLSLLASHDSIDAADPETQSWKGRLVGLVGELKYEGPFVNAGLIALAAGPVGAAIAGLIAAGVGGAALAELMGEITTHPHADEFAKALTAGGILLWVYAPDSSRESKATRVLEDAGATNVHTVERPA
jgi:hypothetical protein